MMGATPPGEAFDAVEDHPGRMDRHNAAARVLSPLGYGPLDRGAAAAKLRVLAPARQR